MTLEMPMARFFRRMGRLPWAGTSDANVFRAPFGGGWIECERSLGERHVRGPMPDTPPHWIFRLLTQTGEAEMLAFDEPNARVAELLEGIQRSARGEEGGEEGVEGVTSGEHRWDQEYRDAWLRLRDWADNRTTGVSWGLPDIAGLSGPAARVLERVREAVVRANAKERAVFLVRQAGQEFMAARLLTAGPMRALAMAIEPLLRLHEAQYQDFEARLAGLRAQVEEDLARFAELQGWDAGEAPTGVGPSEEIQRSAEVDTFEAERADRRGDWQRARDLYASAGSSWAAAYDGAEGSRLRSDLAMAAAVCWFRGGHFQETIAFAERVLASPATPTEWVAHTLRELLGESRERLQPARESGKEEE